MPKGIIDYGQMVEQLNGGGLLGNVAMNPYTKRGMGYPSATEGAIPYRGGATVRAYHGTTAEPFQRFDLNRAGSGEGYKSERGVFMTPNKAVASKYGEPADGGRVIPLDVTLKNAARVDWQKAFGPESYSHPKMKKAMDLARKKDKDFLIVDNVIDQGGLQQQIIALNPKGLVKNAKTGGTMFGLLGGLLGLDDDEPR
jgi:hypothetical protein